MPDRVKHLIDQTATRLRLLENGYRPLPAREKRVLVKGWPSMPVNEAAIRDWAQTHTRYLTTAIQITGDLIAFDFDIDDADVLDPLLDAVEEAVPALAEAPIRAGKGAKVMYLARVAEPIGIVMTKAYARGGDAEDRHRLEVFGGATTRYFSCFGPHTLGADTADGPTFAVEYRWSGGSPLEIAAGDLPVVTRAEVLQIVDMAEAALQATGWAPVVRSRSGEVIESKVSDLTPDMEFHCADGRTRNYDDLASYAAENDARCSASWREPGARNRTRCRIDIDDEGVVFIFDYAEYARHYPLDYVPPDGRTKAALANADTARRLGEALAKLAPKADPEEPVAPPDDDPEAVFRALVEDLCDNWAYYPAGGTGEQVMHVYDRGLPPRSVSAFKTQLASMAITVKGPRGGEQVMNPVAVWLKHDRRLTVDGLDFNPSTEDVVFLDAGGRVKLNTYRPPSFDEVEPEGLEVWLAFLRHLLPHPDERAWFENWLACKAQRPTMRGAGVAMVAPGLFGAGRGTLFTILSGVFGEAHCRAVPAAALLGLDSQSSFNEWQADSLFAFCDEIALPDPSLATRRRAYDRLKDLVDPAARKVTVNVKYGRPRQVTCYTALIVASNHVGALPLEEGDRRFAVLSNGRKLLEDQHLAEALFAYKDGAVFRPGFLRAVRDNLLSRDADFEAALLPPMTAAKEDLIDASRGLLEDLIEEVLHLHPQGIMSKRSLTAKVEALAMARGLPQGVRAAAPYEVRALPDGAAGWKQLGRFSVKRHGKQPVFIYRAEGDGQTWTREEAEAKVEAMALADRAAL